MVAMLAPKLPHVCILLSTFNGDKYLQDQIESLISQEGVSISIVARDDGSTDRTVEILKQGLLEGTINELVYDGHIGSTRSFVELMLKAPKADYYAFCDQDDVWNSKKCQELVNLLNNSNSASIAFCNRRIIDGEGKFRKIVNTRPDKLVLNNAIIENSIPGNTMIINVKALEVLTKIKWDNVVHYDALIYLYFSLSGEIYFCQKNLVDYRIHIGNQIGIKKNTIYRILNLRESLQSFRKNADTIIGSKTFIIPSDKITYLENFLDLWNSQSFLLRISKLRKLRIKRQSNFESLFLIIYFLFNCHK